MIKRLGLTLYEVIAGIALVMIPVIALRFGVLSALGDWFGWSDDTAALVRRFSIIVSVASSYWLFVRWRERRTPSELSPDLKSILFSAVMGAAVIALPMVIFFLDGSYSLEAVQFNPEVFRLAIFIFGAALLEEVVFRGVLFRVIERHFGLISALIVPSVIFSALHLFNAEWTGFLPFVSGLLIGLFWSLNFALVRNMWAIAFNHAVWNFTIILAGVPLTGQSAWREMAPLQTTVSGPRWWNGGAGGPEESILTITLLVLVVAGMLWIVFRKPQFFCTPYDKNSIAAVLSD